MKLQPWFLALALGLAGGAAGQDAPPPLTLAGTWTLDRALATARPVRSTHRLQLALVTLRETRWQPEAILAATLAAAGILAQCGIRLERAELQQFAGGPPAYRDLWTPASRQFARRLILARPAIFFVEGTRHRPAFDAEAFGPANTATRPELVNTIWITADARDVPVVIAHELAHVLSGSGEHSDEAGNLMGEETSPATTGLTAVQCERMLGHGERTGLLQRERS